MGADSMANPLRNSQLEKVEILAREALQNSFDERIQGSAATLKFKCKRHLLVGEQKKRFIENLALKSIQKKAPLFPSSHHWFQEGSVALEDLQDLEKPFPILEVSDFNANGLGGRWNRGQSINDRFYNLVLSINKTRKQERPADELALGSYGVGKMVFALCSNLRTMVYYSRFSEDARSGGAASRLMATAFLPSFEDASADQEFSGHAYFGLDSDEPQNPKMPFENKEADQLFQSLGFNPRTQNEFGTTILLPCCDIKIPELCAAIEKWWWPLLTDAQTKDQIEISLEDEEGKKYRPNPGVQNHLKPFINCLNNMQLGYKDDRSIYQEVKIIHSQEQKVTGSIGLASLPEKRHPDELDGNVAFVRGGLVIEYNKKSFREDGHAAVGVFKANDEYHQYFVFSEPEAHDHWNQYHDRLKTFMGEAGSSFIRQCLTAIQTKSRDFQSSQEQTQKVRAADTLGFLDDLLGRLIKPRKRGLQEPPPPSKRLPFIHKDVSRKVSGKEASDGIKFRIGLSDEDGPSEIDYLLLLTLKSVVDSSEKTDEFIPFSLALNGESPVKFTEPTPLKVLLRKGEELSGEASGDVHPAWTTCWSISLEPDKEGERQ